MTPQEFWELVVTRLCLRGKLYAYKVKAFGEVVELLPVDPGCVGTEANSSWDPSIRSHSRMAPRMYWEPRISGMCAR